MPPSLHSVIIQITTPISPNSHRMAPAKGSRRSRTISPEVKSPLSCLKFCTLKKTPITPNTTSKRSHGRKKVLCDWPSIDAGSGAKSRNNAPTPKEKTAAELTNSPAQIITTAGIAAIKTKIKILRFRLASRHSFKRSTRNDLTRMLTLFFAGFLLLLLIRFAKSKPLYKCRYLRPRVSSRPKMIFIF